MTTKLCVLGGVVVLLAVVAFLVLGPGLGSTVATYTIADKSGVLEITIRGWEGPVEPILGAFQACQQGNCACPTDEYENLEHMDVQTTDGEIVLRLTPKPGASLDQEDIRACLDFTLREAGRQPATPN